MLARDCCVPEECTVLFEFPIVLGYVRLPKRACHNPQCRGKARITARRESHEVEWGRDSGIYSPDSGQRKNQPHFLPLSLWPQGLQPQRRH